MHSSFIWLSPLRVVVYTFMQILNLLCKISWLYCKLMMRPLNFIVLHARRHSKFIWCVVVVRYIKRVSCKNVSCHICALAGLHWYNSVVRDACALYLWDINCVNCIVITIKILQWMTDCTDNFHERNLFKHCIYICRPASRSLDVT